MKKYLVGALIFLFTINVQAQWYSKYGVNDINDLTEIQLGQALQKCSKNINAGKTLFGVGIGCELVAGYCIYYYSWNYL